MCGGSWSCCWRKSSGGGDLPCAGDEPMSTPVEDVSEEPPTPGTLRLSGYVGALVLSETEEFLGSTFPINEEERLFLAAGHTIPTKGRESLSILIHRGSRLQMTPVEQVEVLEGQPDVVVLRAADGVAPSLRFSGGEALLLEDVNAAGFPEHSIRETEPGMKAMNIRALKGSITGILEAGEEPLVRGPAYEVSFVIPAGMSGGPVFSNGPFPRVGLVGVCLANHETYSVLWHEERDEGVE
jgi:hypothetical protein